MTKIIAAGFLLAALAFVSLASAQTVGPPGAPQVLTPDDAPVAVPPYPLPPVPASLAHTALPPPVVDPNSECEVRIGVVAATSNDLMTFTLPFLDKPFGGRYSGPANVSIFVDQSRARVFTTTTKVQWCESKTANWVELDVDVKDGVVIVPLQRIVPGFVDLRFLVGGSVINAVVPGDTRARALRSN